MSGTQTWILRISVVLGMVAAVVTILYFTPMPEHHFQSCDRPCHELEWPMICRIKIVLEEYHTLSSSCVDCPQNLTDCENKYCVIGDGARRHVYTANRQLPGPVIQVCQNDIVLVDVANRVPGQEFTIHWRGQIQQGTQVMDGVPMVTQCPISSYTTFQYKFRVITPGTHLWHAHSNTQSANGIFGALIVRQPDVIEPQKRLYDVDAKEYLMVVSEIDKGNNYYLDDSKTEKTSLPFSLLLNGAGNIKKQKFTVRKGFRYRFRLAYAAGKVACPIELSIDKHNFKIISMDGHPVNPVEASTVVLGKGERIDFILKANKPPGVYDINIKSQCVGNITGELHYESSDQSLNLVQSDIKSDVIKRIFTTEMCNSELGLVCLEDIQSLFVMPAALRTEKVDKQLHLVFTHLTMSDYDMVRHLRKSQINNVTFTFPSSPLLTQYDEIPVGQLCNRNDILKQCENRTTCECVHIEQVPLDDSVEIILLDNGGDRENIFHLHGYSFYVVGYRQFPEPIRIETVKQLDENGELFHRNLISPVLKDTIRIPKFGVVAIRFVANNPGFWMLRDELSHSWSSGMDMILQVGTEDDVQSAPFDFPTCGDWVGPEFFLA